MLPNAFLVTPNLREAAKRTALEITDVRLMEKAAAAIARFGREPVGVSYWAVLSKSAALIP